MPVAIAPLAFLFSTPLAALAAGAAAVSIPVIIHLLNRRRFRVVTWAAMRFLLAAQRKNTRKMRLEQLILLMVRTAVVLLLVLAMASVMPWAEHLWHRLFPGSSLLAAGATRRTYKVLVLDGSFSMAYKTADSTSFQRAKQAAQRILSQGGGGDGYSVVLMAAPPRRIVAEASYDAARVSQEIEALRLPHGNADLPATLNAVEDLVRQTPGQFEDCEVYFLTDLQRSTWAARMTGDPGSTLQRIQSRARTILVDVGRDGSNNLAVTGLYLDAPFAMTGAPVPITVVLHNYSADTRRQVRLELLIGKARQEARDPPFALRGVGQQLVDVGPGQTSVTFSHRFNAPGDYALQVRAEHDDLDLDDVRSAVLRVRDTIPVLLVNGKSGTADPYDGATEWLRDALNPFQNEAAPRTVPARPTVMPAETFSVVGDLTPYDCVYLCDVDQLSPAEVRRLEAHLQQGGGVVFCLGPQVKVEAYNRLLYKNGEGLLPARLLGMQQADKDRAFTFHAEEHAFREPPLAAFSDSTYRASLLGVRFRQYVRTEVAPRGRGRKLLTFIPEPLRPKQEGKAGADPLPVGEAALVEGTRFRGRVLLLTTAVNMEWSAWPVSPSFPALMQELLHHAVAGRLREQSVMVGDVLEEYLPSGGAGLDVVMHTPDGRTEASTTQVRDEATTLRWADTDASGLYRALVGQHPAEHLFAVNVPATTDTQQACESDLLRTDATELQNAYPGWQFQVVTDPAQVVRTGGPAGGTDLTEQPVAGLGRAIARWLLLTMLALLLIEVVLAWRFGHYSAVALAEAPLAAGKLLPVAAAILAGIAFVALTGVLTHAAWTGDFLGFLPESFRRGLEARLGVPAPAAGEGARWHLEFNPFLWDAAADPWLAGALALGATVLVYYFYRREGHTARPAYKLLLAGLRLFLILLTLAVLLPQLRLWFERQGWPDIALIIDDSASMRHSDRYQDPDVREAAARIAQEANLSTPERLQLAQALLTRSKPDWLEALLTNRRVKIHIYHCSSRAARIADVTETSDIPGALQAIQSLSADGTSSQLGTAVRQVLNDFRGSSLSAVVLLTDGITTEGEDLVKVSRYAAQVGTPLFLVGIGDAHDARDLKLHDLVVEDSVYVGDRLVFEARLTGQGYTDLTVPVILKEKDAAGREKELKRENVTVDPQGKPVKFRLTHQPLEAGERTFVIEVPEQRDEQGPSANNRLERTVFVREAKLIKILYVEGTARYEYRYVKHLLERESERDRRNKTMDLKVLLLDADPEYAQQDKSALAEFPTREELNGFDVVIFGDVDPRDDKVKKHLLHVADFVRERGGGFLMIAGDRFSPHAYKDTPLRDILPIEVLGAAPPEADFVEGYRPEQTAAGRFHPIFRFHPDEAENTAVWNQLAELLWYAEGYRAARSAEVLLVHPRLRRAGGESGRSLREDDRHPLMVQQFVGAGRSMFFGTDETWRWRFREHELRFNQFWIQTVRYLARSRLGRLKLSLDRQTPYRRGEAIKVTVRFPDDSPPPDPGADVQVMLKRSPLKGEGGTETEVETLRLARVEGSRATFESLLTRTPVGEYKFELSVPAVAAPRPRAECLVLPPPGETEQLRMNQQDMERAAEESKGRFYTLANAAQLLDDLPAGARVSLQSPQPPRLLWNHALIFVLALSLLTAEWTLRKRKHLL